MWDPHEQLAEMLLLRGDAGDVTSALSALEQQLARYPNRYGSLAGAGRCADQLGNDVKASQYYGQVTNCVSQVCVLLYVTVCDCVYFV